MAGFAVPQCHQGPTPSLCPPDHPHYCSSLTTCTSKTTLRGRKKRGTLPTRLWCSTSEGNPFQEVPESLAFVSLARTWSHGHSNQSWRSGMGLHDWFKPIRIPLLNGAPPPPPAFFESIAASYSNLLFLKSRPC